MKRTRVFLAVVLSVLALSMLICAGCGGQGENGSNANAQEENVAEATTMRLEKAEGLVEVADENGREREAREKLPLFSGYVIVTGENSFSWFNLDDTKLAKMDEKSTVSIEKEDKHLKLQVDVGGLYFNVTKPLDEDEHFEIRTASMTVGIRGTCGWVDAEGEAVYLLQGKVICESQAGGESVEIVAGQYARFLKAEGKFETGGFGEPDIPGFVWDEMAAETFIYELPMTPEEFELFVQDLYRDGEIVTVKAGGGENMLVFDTLETVYCHLVLDEGVNLSVADGGQMNISGTLTVHGNIENDGFIALEEDAALHVTGTFQNAGMLNNGWIEKGFEDESVRKERQRCRILAENGIVSDGYLENYCTIEGDLTIDGGSAALYAGNVGRIILNDGVLLAADGTYEDLVQNGGDMTNLP